MKKALDKAGPDEATGEKLPSRAGDWLQLRGFTKWIALAAIIGVLGGAAASAFTEVVDAAKEHGFGRVAGTTEGGVLRTANPLLVLALPALGGLLVGLTFRLSGTERDGAGTDAVTP